MKNLKKALLKGLKSVSVYVVLVLSLVGMAPKAQAVASTSLEQAATNVAGAAKQAGVEAAKAVATMLEGKESDGLKMFRYGAGFLTGANAFRHIINAYNEWDKQKYEKSKHSAKKAALWTLATSFQMAYHKFQPLFQELWMVIGKMLMRPTADYAGLGVIGLATYYAYGYITETDSNFGTTVDWQQKLVAAQLRLGRGERGAQAAVDLAQSKLNETLSTTKNSAIKSAMSAAVCFVTAWIMVNHQAPVA